MAYFRILNARQSIRAGGQDLEPEPLFLQNGSWVGVLSTDNEQAVKDLAEHPLANPISQSDYDGLKKNGMKFMTNLSLIKDQPVIPKTENPAEPVEAEKPETVEEVLVMEKASSPPDSLAEKKPKPRSTKKK
jgi:hypothetical protein